MQKISSTQEAPHIDQVDDFVNVGFASALADELDAAGFVSGPGRCAAFGKLMGLSRSQASRILNGKSSPTISNLWPLRRLGVSLDRIVDKANVTKPLTQTVYLNGEPVSASVQTGVSGKSCGAALIPHGTGHELIAVRLGTKLPPDAIPIQWLGFEVYDTLAIIEDDINTLEMLDRVMSDAFHTAPFFLATNFLDELTGKDIYKAILMDWRLPDMDGEVLVARIREKTNAPIFILTGDTAAGQAITRALGYDDVYHVAKPAEMQILKKMISNEIGRADVRK